MVYSPIAKSTDHSYSLSFINGSEMLRLKCYRFGLFPFAREFVEISEHRSEKRADTEKKRQERERKGRGRDRKRCKRNGKEISRETEEVGKNEFGLPTAEREEREREQACRTPGNRITRDYDYPWLA